MRRLVDPDCEIRVNGVDVPARAGETVAAALLVETGWREVYCGMGACFVCVVTIDGRRGCRACLELVRPGMVVETEVADAA